MWRSRSQNERLPKGCMEPTKNRISTKSAETPKLTPQGRPPAPNTSQQPRGFKKRQVGGRVYCMEAGEKESDDPHMVVSGTFVVNTLPTTVLFDTGATHSFINPITVEQMNCDLEEMDVQLCVTTPIGSRYQSELVARNCTITIQGKRFVADLILLGVQGYDVILGMDWLTKYRATV